MGKSPSSHRGKITKVRMRRGTELQKDLAKIWHNGNAGIQKPRHVTADPIKYRPWVELGMDYHDYMDMLKENDMRINRGDVANNNTAHAFPENPNDDVKTRTWDDEGFTTIVGHLPVPKKNRG